MNREVEINEELQVIRDWHMHHISLWEINEDEDDGEAIECLEFSVDYTAQPYCVIMYHHDRERYSVYTDEICLCDIVRADIGDIATSVLSEFEYLF